MALMHFVRLPSEKLMHCLRPIGGAPRPWPADC
jgi:hypothetical protein